MQHLDLPIALVTGASSGIGRATALALADAGYLTYATARHPDTMSDLQRQGLQIMRLDVTDEDTMVAAVRAIESSAGVVDVLVNNAGYSELGPVEEVPMERVRRQFETNVFGLIRLTQLVLPGMRRKGQGRIVNVSSMGGEFTTPLSGIYHASKYAVEAISDALRMEVRSFGIAVIVVQPGVVLTPLAHTTLESLQPEPDGPYAAPLNRFRQFLEVNGPLNEDTALLPEDVARCIVEAVNTADPLVRYVVGVEAEQLLARRHKVSDREWDALYSAWFDPGE